jgi:hypothetical protein
VFHLARKKQDPADSLARFMYGIYDYYTDKGMPQKTAKARMVDSTLEVLTNTIKEEDEIPDQMVVLMAQWMARALNNRGAKITKEIKKHHDDGTFNESMLHVLHEIKGIKDATDIFIENYKGWHTDGSEKDS